MILFLPNCLLTQSNSVPSCLSSPLSLYVEVSPLPLLGPVLPLSSSVDIPANFPEISIRSIYSFLYQDFWLHMRMLMIIYRTMWWWEFCHFGRLKASWKSISSCRSYWLLQFYSFRVTCSRRERVRHFCNIRLLLCWYLFFWRIWSSCNRPFRKS